MDKDSLVAEVTGQIQQESRDVKVALDRSNQADAAKLGGTALLLIRSIDDALVIMQDALNVGTRQYMRTGIEQSIKALMAQDRTYATRIRIAAQKNGNAPLKPDQPHLSPEIVCLVGSTRFKSAFELANHEMTINGKIVLSVGSFPHASLRQSKEEAWGDEVASLLDELHCRKIDIADTVYVVNPKASHNAKHGYIGYTTAREILYAVSLKKNIESLEPLPKMEAILEAAKIPYEIVEHADV